MDELKRKSVISSLWALFERFGYLSIQFITNIFLSRLLTPNDFGDIAIITIFILLSNIILDSGFGAAIIQKKNINEDDKSTAFCINVIIAVVIYIIIYITSPFISSFFNSTDISTYLRVLAIVVIIDSFSLIQNALLFRSLSIKKITIIKIISIIIAAFVAIIMAYKGFGIWALIFQYLIYSIIRGVLIWLYSTWRPRLCFKSKAAKEMFGFGSNLLFTSLIAELYSNFQQILIGHFYSQSDLGYYSQARQLQNVPSAAISQTINSVAFPVYSKIQEDYIKLKEYYIENLRIVCMLNTPLMILLSIIGYDLILFIYTNKWVGSVNYFKFLCLTSGVLTVLHQSARAVFKAIGKSKIIFRLEILKSLIGIIMIFIGITYWGIWGVLFALALVSFIEVFLNGYYIHKYIKLNILLQLQILIPYLITSLGIGTIIELGSHYIINENILLTLISKSIIIFITYFIICKLLKFKGYIMIEYWALKLIRNKIFSK